MDWEAYWQRYPESVGKEEYHRQVGNTVSGQPMSDSDFGLMVSRIASRLELNPEDDLLDLCCGNGMITVRLAPQCRSVIGVDFSAPLVEIASGAHAAGNVRYCRADTKRLGDQPAGALTFNKVLLQSCLQHFSGGELGHILAAIKKLGAPPCLVVLGGVPDRGRKWKFFDSPRRRAQHLWWRITRRDTMGTWWSRDEIRRIANHHGFECSFAAECSDPSGTHYRFDAVLRARS